MQLVVALFLALTFAACSSTTMPVGPTPNPTPTPPPDEGASGVPFTGTLTMDKYDWLSTYTPYLGIIDVDLSSGQKTRVLEGQYPWRHPSGKIVFAQGCG